MSQVIFLECTKCGTHLPSDIPQNVCAKDGGILFARYDLKSIKAKFTPDALAGREASLWRYREVLPSVEALTHGRGRPRHEKKAGGLSPVTLGEGFTPLLPSREFLKVWVKDEGLNPTGSYKARGISVAVTVAKALGIKKIAMPSAGNAGSALAAYAAAAHQRLRAHG